MDQVALVFYPYLRATLRRMDEYSDLISDIQWVDTVIADTIWRDPMWRAMLTVQHDASCSPLIPQGKVKDPDMKKYIVLMSNARLGSTNVAKQFHYRTDRTHVPASNA